MSCGQRKAERDPSGNCLNPYDMPPNTVFSYKVYNDITIPALVVQLQADKKACAQEKIKTATVDNSVELFGINCRRLLVARGKVHSLYALQFNELAEENIDPKDKARKMQLLVNDYNNDCIEFTTTVKLILKNNLKL
jgi:hypothetical protein